MLSKCIGMISWFPDNVLRAERVRRFRNTLKQIDKYFKLPIVIIAQNWHEEDFDLEYSNSIKIYNYSHALGVTGANVILREKLLLEDYDYFIHLDDDINFIGTQRDVDNYLKEIDNHPNMFGQLKKFQLAAQSKYMLKLMDWEYIKGLESYRGDLWEDVAYMNTYKRVYPNKFFTFKNTRLDMDFGPSEKDPASTWYTKDINQRIVQQNTNRIINQWVESLRGR